ncbi:MAG: glycosyltransferase family 4 protein, partial [bacterium]
MSGPALALMADPAALHTQRWARAFRDCGYAVQILSAGTQTAVDSIPVIPILDATRDPGTGALARSWANLQEYGRVRRLRERFDLVHVHYLSCGRHLALLKGLPRLLITPWGSDILPRLSPLSPHQLHWGRVALHAAQSVCALSHYMGGELQRIYGVAPSRIHVIPWGADTTLFDPARV